MCWDVEEIWGEVGKCLKRCEKVCWGVGEVLKEVCWGFPCLPSHFPTSPFTSTIPQHTFSHLSPTLPHNPLTSCLISPTLFENLHTVMVILALFEEFSGKVCSYFWPLTLSASSNMMHFVSTVSIMRA